MNRSFPADELVEELDAIADEICANSAEAIARIKKLYDQGYATTLEAGLEIESKADTDMADTSSELAQFSKKKFKG